MALSFYVGILLPIFAPMVVARSLIWFPLATHRFPFLYLFGLFLMAAIYGIYYYIYIGDKKWIYGIVFAVFYSAILIWQLPYAILNLRDTRWGTR
jgi:hyaluronan synthase